MSTENKRTIEVYKETAQVYLKNNIEHDNMDLVKAERKREKLNTFLKASFSCLPQQASVFEIGSGDGTNAKLIEKLGFNVTASDTVEGFIQASRNQGLKTIKFDAVEDSFSEKYFAVFCWRVFVHFTSEDVLKTMQKVYDALENNGVFVFNVINRETKLMDEQWIDFGGEYHMGADRYYHYFSQKEFDDMIKQTKFQIQDFHRQGGESNNKWLVYVLKK